MPPPLQHVANPVDSVTALNRIIDVVNTILVPQQALPQVQIGAYILFTDADGSLKIKAPDNSTVTLVAKT